MPSITQKYHIVVTLFSFYVRTFELVRPVVSRAVRDDDRRCGLAWSWVQERGDVYDPPLAEAPCCSATLPRH